jgi:2'-5' RNA ligase
MSAIVYSLWWKPAGTTFETLAQVIREFAQEHGDTPFEPHVTLLGNVGGTEREILRTSAELAGSLRPVPTVLTGPAYGREHFQCVYMLVDQTPAVMGAHARARQAFRMADGPYMPHLSLVYGLFRDEQKIAIIGRLPNLRMTFDASAVCVIRADSDDPKDWRELGAFPIDG